MTLKTMFPCIWRSNTQIFGVQDWHSSTTSSFILYYPRKVNWRFYIVRTLYGKPSHTKSAVFKRRVNHFISPEYDHLNTSHHIQRLYCRHLVNCPFTWSSPSFAVCEVESFHMKFTIHLFCSLEGFSWHSIKF